MVNRLVDVARRHSEGIRTVLHVFPVTVSDLTAKEKGDDAFKQKALEAAANSHLVPDDELDLLEATMHISRSGPLQPCEDRLGVMAETKEGLEQIVRDHAYMLWEEEHHPQGKADEHWQRAQHDHFCARAYALWEREGRPEAKADEHWHCIRAFEE